MVYMVYPRLLTELKCRKKSFLKLISDPSGSLNLLLLLPLTTEYPATVEKANINK